MADHPILLFPAPTEVQRHKKGGGPSRISLPGGRRQVARLGHRVEELEAAFESRRTRIAAQPGGLIPEQVLVLETIGSVTDFIKAVRRIPGLDWLGEWDKEDIPPDDDFFHRGDNERTLSGRVFLVMSNQEGMRQLRRLWEVYRKEPDDPQFAYGRMKWKHLFNQLRELRPWGVQDRLRETGLRDEWTDRVDRGLEVVPTEVELWFRTAEEERSRASRDIRNLIVASDGEVVAECVIEEAAYHGVLADLPIDEVEAILEADGTALVQADHIMFMRPVGQAVVGREPTEEADEAGAEEVTTEREQVAADAPPVVAVLDGLPQENHPLLQGRLVVDDPDALSDSYEAGEERHGTGVLSCLLHGDLGAAGEPLPERVYVRPILTPRNPTLAPGYEAIPERALPADLVHRAVKRICEGDGDGDAAAPSVCLINLSVADISRQLGSGISAWARLLDYLSWNFGVLFLVSAGNHSSGLELRTGRDSLEELLEDPERLEGEALGAAMNLSWNRRLLSPAEAINVLTIGAAHDDDSEQAAPGRLIDPISSRPVPSPISSVGPGYRRAVKPDLYFPGGRQPYRESLGAQGDRLKLEPSITPRAPGIQVASPRLARRTTHVRGTSYSTALATREACRALHTAERLIGQAEWDVLPRRIRSAVVKALVVHSASWAGSETVIQRAADRTLTREELGYFLGFGFAKQLRLSCDDHQVTLLGYGSLATGEAHRYTLPLPESLSGVAGWRALTGTLAWLSPIVATRQEYRGAQLWFAPYGEERGEAEELLQVSRAEGDWQAVRRGTVQHEVFSGEAAGAFAADAAIELQVNCRADAIDSAKGIPYGFVVSLEATPELQVPIYNEVSVRIRPRVRVEARQGP